MTSLQPPHLAPPKPSEPDDAQRGSDKRARILLAAREVCQSRGYEGTHMDTIASQAGVSKGTLYNFFASKEQLFTDMLLEGYDQYRKLLPALGDTEHDVETRLAQLVEGLTENYDALATHILISHQAWSVSLQTDATRARVFPELQRFYTDFQRALEGVLREGTRSGLFRSDLDVPTVASGFIGMLDGMLYRAGFADEEMRAVCGPDGARRAFDWLFTQIRLDAPAVLEPTGEAQSGRAKHE